MSASVQIGLVMALLCAFTSILGFLYKHRGAVESPPISLKSPVSSTVALFRSRWWLLGIAVAMVSWGFHVAALALAPISIVQTVIAGGLVLLGVVADRLFGFTVTRREWIGVILTAAGLAFLAATLEGTADSAHNDWDIATLTAYVGGLSLLGVLAAALARDTTRGPTLLAASAGLIWGASDVSIKALSKHTDQGLAVLGHPLALVILVLVAGGPGHLGPQPAGGQGGAGDRGDQRRRQHRHDRLRADRVRRAAAGRPRRADAAPAGLRAGDRRRLDDAAADGRTRSTPRRQIG